MINTTMTEQNVNFIVNNFEGDFFGFHSYFENTIVVSYPCCSWFFGSDF